MTDLSNEAPMSACISKHGEFSWHECSVPFVCDYCGVFDEDAAYAALNEAHAKVARVEALMDHLESKPLGGAEGRARWAMGQKIRAALEGWA